MTSAPPTPPPAPHRHARRGDAVTAAMHEVGVLRTRVEALVTSADRITRETERLAQLCDRQAAELRDAQRKLHAAATAHCWTNEDGKRFVFADDLAEALGYGPTAASPDTEETQP